MKKKLTHMIWRDTGESILLALAVMAAVLYLLSYNRFFVPAASWTSVLNIFVLLTAASTAIGGGYGYRRSVKLKQRLEQLREAMLLLEKGQFSRAVPVPGEDELGRLAEQLGRIGKKWEEQVTSLQRLSTHNAQLAEQARYSAIAEERQRLARELHDAVSQQLFAISMTATAVGRTLEKNMAKARRQIALIEEMASVAQSEMRALLMHLRPIHLEGKRLSQGVVELLRELQAKVPLDISWELDEDIALPKGIEDHLFRIVQEAISNTLRHAKASRMELSLSRRADSVRLLIYDDGIGFALNDTKHTSYGLVSMRERVNEVGGFLHLVTAPGKGTRIDIRVPLLTEMKEEGDSLATTD